MSDNNKREYTTSTGILVKSRGLPQMLVDKVQSSVPKPDAPKYKITTASGDEVWEPHNETTLETDEDKLLYRRYVEELAKADGIINERMFRLICMRGLEVTMPEDTSWIDMQRFLGVDIPEDPLELKYLYIQTEVIGSIEDITTITDMVMEATGVPEEALAEARRSFPSALQEAQTVAGHAKPRKRKVVK